MSLSVVTKSHFLRLQSLIIRGSFTPCSLPASSLSGKCVTKLSTPQNPAARSLAGESTESKQSSRNSTHFSRRFFVYGSVNMLQSFLDRIDADPIQPRDLLRRLPRTTLAEQYLNRYPPSA